MTIQDRGLRQAIKSAGGQSEFDRTRQLYHNSLTHFENNFQNWLEKHNEEWIAVFNSRLISYAKTYSELEKKLQKRNLKPNDVVVKHITKRKTTTLF